MPFKYQPQWQGPLSGRSFEKQTEDFLNAIESRVDEIDTRQTPSDATPMPPGVGNAGTALEYSRADHSHPAQDTVSGNAGTATRLAEGRTITLSNEGTGTAFFDGSADVTLPLEVSCIAAGSSARRMIADRFADVINVKDYGAKGDGATDDTTAIKAAIVALRLAKVPPDTGTGGPLLYFPYGVYLISEQLTIQWAQRVGVFLDGATVRATAAINAMLYIDNNWQEGNTIEGGTWDMNRIASVGVQITKYNNKVRFENSTIKNVGDGHVGLYLGTVGESSGDGQEFRISNIRVTDWISNSSDQNGNLLYDATGILVAVNDCYFNNITVGCCSTGIRLTGGGHIFSGVHVWQGATMELSNPRWSQMYGIKDEASDNEWENLYLDNCGTGYWIGKNKNLAIGNLQCSRGPASSASGTESGVIISTGKATSINIDFLYCRFHAPVGIGEQKVVYNRDATTSSETANNLFPAAQYVHMRHNIKKTAGFKIVDPAFDITNAGMFSLGLGSASTLTADYYFLGYLAAIGSGAAVFSVGMADASADIELVRSGSTITLTATLRSGTAANASFAVGAQELDTTYYGLPLYPVYVKRSASVWSNIKIQCSTRTCMWAFYKSAFATCLDAIVASPSILSEKTFGNS